jgi:hypothetical protein
MRYESMNVSRGRRHAKDRSGGNRTGGGEGDVSLHISQSASLSMPLLCRNIFASCTRPPFDAATTASAMFDEGRKGRVVALIERILPPPPRTPQASRTPPGAPPARCGVAPGPPRRAAPAHRPGRGGRPRRQVGTCRRGLLESSSWIAKAALGSSARREVLPERKQAAGRPAAAQSPWTSPPM